ncbi:hypothetical protein MMC28_000639 [Mycoblastus sanguinarius]|nr:hypothetical protein [Mycoblastus sanguinarius]
MSDFLEPEWETADEARQWLEERFPLGDKSLGSPLYQYLAEAAAKGVPTMYLGAMLSASEAKRRWREYPRLTQLYPNDIEPFYPDPPPDSNQTKVPVVRNDRHERRKQPNKRQKPPKTKTQVEEPTYVRKLRSGIGKRKHLRPELVCLVFKGRKAEKLKVQ